MRGGDSEGPPPFRSPGFTLVELVVVLAIVLILSGGVSLAFLSSSPGTLSQETVKREGQYAAQWLQRIFYKALLSGRSFSFFKLSSLQPQSKLKVIWENNEVEEYDGRGNAWFLNHSASPVYCIYNPKWNTVSPAFTIQVGSSQNRPRPLEYIVVTPYCRVSCRDDAPRD